MTSLASIVDIVGRTYMTTLIIPIIVCYYYEVHNGINIQQECNIPPSKVIHVM